MKKTFLLLSAALLVGCSNGGSKTSTETPFEIEKFKTGVTEDAYGIVHVSYAGTMSVTTDANGSISKISLDEAHFPHDWAKITVAAREAEVDFVDIKYVASASATEAVSAKYAKEIYINSVKYTLNYKALAEAADKHATLEATDIDGYTGKVPVFATIYGVALYTADDVKLSVSDAYLNDAWMKNYFTSLNINGTSAGATPVEPTFGLVAKDTVASKNKSATRNILVNDSGAYLTGFSTLVGNNGVLKSKNNYWPVTGTAPSIIGWKGNVDAFLRHIVTYGFAGMSTFNKNTDFANDYQTTAGSLTAKKHWTIKVSDDLVVVTGCTWSDMDQYVAVAVKLYAKIKVAA